MTSPLQPLRGHLGVADAAMQADPLVQSLLGEDEAGRPLAAALIFSHLILANDRLLSLALSWSEEDREVLTAAFHEAVYGLLRVGQVFELSWDEAEEAAFARAGGPT